MTEREKRAKKVEKAITIINMDYLLKKDRKRNTRAILISLLFIVLPLLYCLYDWRISVIFIAMELICIAIYWIPRIRKNIRCQRALKNKNFKICKTKLYNKRTDAGMMSDVDTHYLMFEKQNNLNYNYAKEASWKEFKRNLGDECYLLLLFNEKTSDYEVDSVFWANEAIIAPELERYFESEE